MNDQFPHIVRIGVAAELSNGQRVMLFSDDPQAKLTVDTDHEHAMPWDTSRPVRISTLTSITISDLSRYWMQDVPEPSAANAIDNIRKELEP